MLASAEGRGSGETGFGSRAFYIWLKLYILVQKCTALGFSKMMDVEAVRGEKGISNGAVVKIQIIKH